MQAAKTLRGTAMQQTWRCAPPARLVRVWASTNALVETKQQTKLKLSISAVVKPHPDKAHYGGEDAHFFSDAHGGAMGVADGVGGWAESGVNPADYSRRLMEIALDAVESTPHVNPRAAMDQAHRETKLPGSATACVMQLCQRSNALTAANLGDSGFLLLRNGEVVKRSTPQEHFFDCPLQLGAFPEFVEATDSADLADYYSVPVLAGDVIIAGSDGLWDNCYEHELLALAPRSVEEGPSSAQRIADMARDHAADPDFASPYTREAITQGFDLPIWEKLACARVVDGKLVLGELTGGKMDDITVLVAVVVEEPVEDEQPEPVEAPATLQEEELRPAAVAQAPAAGQELEQEQIGLPQVLPIPLAA